MGAHPWPPGGLPHGEHPYDYGYGEHDPHPPPTITMRWCPACGRDDRVAPLSDRHRTGGLRCGGTPVEARYALAPSSTADVSNRSIHADGRIVPREGDLARVLEDIALESGVRLRADQNVLVSRIVSGGHVVGVKWRDGDGTHVMALPVDKIEVVP